MHDEITQNAVLNRAIEAFMQQPVEDGPDTALIEQTLGALEAATRDNGWRRAARFAHRHRLAACIILPLPFIAVLVAFLLPGSPAPVLGAVIEKLNQAQTVQFRMTYSHPDLPGNTITCMTKGRRVRMAFDQGPVIISHADDERILTLMPDQKKAFIARRAVADNAEASKQICEQWFAAIRTLQDQPGSFQGTEELDGKRVNAFRVEKQGMQFTILADPRTQRPVRFTMEVPAFDVKGIMSDFVFDAELNDELFSLDPPQGYKVTEQPDDGMGTIAKDDSSGQDVTQMQFTTTDADFAAPTENDVIAYVRKLAEANDNVFPSDKQITEVMNKKTMAIQQQAQSASQQQRQEIMAEFSSFIMQQNRASTYLRKIGAGQNTLVGEGVRLGDATKPVYLWALADQKHARVIYGDLSVRELDVQSTEFKAIAAAGRLNLGNGTGQPLREGAPKDAPSRRGPPGDHSR